MLTAISRRTAVRAAVGLTAMGGITYAAQSDQTLGLRRQATFWGRVFPVVFDYYWAFSSSSPYVQYQKYWESSRGDEDADKEARKALLKRMHEKNAPKMLQVMLDLKGLYIKLGQVLSVTQLPIPESYRVLFRTLQSDVPGWEEFTEVVKPVLELEFGRPLEELFEKVDPVPCGAASIGQAHRAVLKDSDDEVIIKVQYPDAAWQVPADIQCVGDLLNMCVRAGVLDESASKLSFDEFARQFKAELDYEAERQNLQEIYASSIRPGSPYLKHGVVVPNVYTELCTGKVITMTLLPGPKLEEEARRQLEMLGIDTSKGFKSLVRRDAPSDDQSGASSKRFPSWVSSAGRIVGNTIGFDAILWTVRTLRRMQLWSIAAAVSTVNTIAPVLPNDWIAWADSHHAALEQAQRVALTESWINALFDVHGDQIFNLGLFNADPHPGNILVLHAEDGDKPDNRLGLIDFGQCKRLTDPEQKRVAALILAVANHEPDQDVADAFRRLGVQTKNDSTEFLSSFAHLMFGKFQPYHMDHAWHKRIHKMDSIVYFPNELSMVYRSAMLLRGLGMSLQVNPSVGDHWRSHAQAALDRPSPLVVRETVAETKRAATIVGSDISPKATLLSL